MFYTGQRMKKRFGYILLPIALLYTVASGQRGGLAYAIAMMTISLLMHNHYISKKKIIQNKTFKWILVLAVISFSLLTVLNGRASNGNVIAAILKRFTSENQGIRHTFI